MDDKRRPPGLGVSLIAACLLVMMPSSHADEVVLTDGSKLVGDIEKLDEGVVVIITKLLGTLEIGTEHVAGIVTERPLRVVLDDGTGITGMLAYERNTGQRVVDATSEEVLTGVTVTRISEPTEGEMQLALTEAEKSPWSARVMLGVNGSSGNSDRFRIHGRGELNREGERNRINLYASGDLDEKDGETTADQVLVGGRVEQDIDERLFGFFRQDFERDEVETIDLRSTSLLGIGYFAIKSPTLVWKPRAGVGYEYEKPSEGDSNDSVLGSLGWSLEHTRAEWLRLTHEFDYLPKVDDPFDDYRLVSDLGAEVPLADSEEWAVRFGLRHKFNSMPQSGIEELDTNYDVSVVYTW